VEPYDFFWILFLLVRIDSAMVGSFFRPTTHTISHTRLGSGFQARTVLHFEQVCISHPPFAYDAASPSQDTSGKEEDATRCPLFCFNRKWRLAWKYHTRLFLEVIAQHASLFLASRSHAGSCIKIGRVFGLVISCSLVFIM
jgi:hypothetical protein